MLSFKTLFRSLIIPYLKRIKCELLSADGLICDPSTLEEWKGQQQQLLINAKRDYVNANYGHMQFFDIHHMLLYLYVASIKGDTTPLQAGADTYFNKSQWLMGADVNSVARYTQQKLLEIANCTDIVSVQAVTWDFTTNVMEMPQ